MQQWDKMHHRKEPKKLGTIPINWFQSVFKITSCADGFEKNLRLLPITGFSDQLVKLVPDPSRHEDGPYADTHMDYNDRKVNEH